jgi:geranylgeranyl diphosphate synthase type II
MVEKVSAITAIYNDLNIKEIATAEANAYTTIALKHLHEINANEEKKNMLKQFAFHLLNREI